MDVACGAIHRGQFRWSDVTLQRWKKTLKQLKCNDLLLSGQRDSRHSYNAVHAIFNTQDKILNLKVWKMKIILVRFFNHNITFKQMEWIFNYNFYYFVFSGHNSTVENNFELSLLNLLFQIFFKYSQKPPSYRKIRILYGIVFVFYGIFLAPRKTYKITRPYYVSFSFSVSIILIYSI